MAHRKKKHYEEMMVRMTKAIEAHYCLEASWYAYSIIEDRMIAVLMATGGAVDARGKLYRNLGRKLDVIKERAKKDTLLRAYFDSAVVAAITKWKDERNTLMHAMANASVPLADIDTQTLLLATNGKELVKTVCRVTRLLRRNRHKIPVPP